MGCHTPVRESTRHCGERRADRWQPVHSGQQCQPGSEPQRRAVLCKNATGLSYQLPKKRLTRSIHPYRPCYCFEDLLITQTLGEEAGANDAVGTPGTRCLPTELQSPRNSWELKSETDFKSNSGGENKGKPDRGQKRKDRTFHLELTGFLTLSSGS